MVVWFHTKILVDQGLTMHAGANSSRGQLSTTYVSVSRATDFSPCDALLREQGCQVAGGSDSELHWSTEYIQY